MTNKTKIIIGILIVAIVIVAIVGISQQTKSEDNTSYENKESINNLFDEYIDENQENETNNIVEENNSIESPVTESKNNNVQNENPQKTVIGKEEQESNNENTEAADRQQAIDLAKEEWGISVDSYDFQAELKEEKIYEVSVINKTNRNVITIYTVNLKTGTVTE